jgi:hypothetical protein
MTPSSPDPLREALERVIRSFLPEATYHGSEIVGRLRHALVAAQPAPALDGMSGPSRAELLQALVEQTQRIRDAPSLSLDAEKLARAWHEHRREMPFAHEDCWPENCADDIAAEYDRLRKSAP